MVSGTVRSPAALQVYKSITNRFNYLALIIVSAGVEPSELVRCVVLVGHVALGAEVDGGAVHARPPDSNNVGGGGGGFAAAIAGDSVVPAAHRAAVDDPEIIGALES